MIHSHNDPKSKSEQSQNGFKVKMIQTYNDLRSKIKFQLIIISSFNVNCRFFFKITLLFSSIINILLHFQKNLKKNLRNLILPVNKDFRISTHEQIGTNNRKESRIF